MGKSAFDWDVYKNRKTALQYLKRNSTLVDTILETEDGTACEFVHSQVISAFGEKLTKYINENGQDYAPRDCEPENNNNNSSSNSGGNVAANGNAVGQIKLVRLPKLNKYTLGILVDCAYSGYIRTDLPSGGIWQVLEVADHYEMIEVIRACCLFLIKNLDRSNCVQFYHIGMRHNHLLYRCAWHKIRANFKHILAGNLRRLGDNWPYVQHHSSNLSSSALNQPSLLQHLNLMNQQNNLNGRRRRRQTGSVANLQQQQQQQQQQDININNNNDNDNNNNNNNIDTNNNNENSDELEIRLNNLATIKFEHFMALLLHDKLNVDNEESVWYAIKMWCNFNLNERSNKIGHLLPCMRFPRFRQGTEFSARHIWRDQLVMNNREAQHQLAVLDRNHRDFLGSSSGLGSSASASASSAASAIGHAIQSATQAHSNAISRDGFSLPCALYPRQLRPRIPHSILLAIGGWKQGQPTTLIESYDINCNLWFESPSKIMSPLAYHGIECIQGLLYICGGTDGTEILNEVFSFDPKRGDCQQRPSMREARCYVSTAHLAGHLYAMGGHNGIQRMKSVERYDYGTGSGSSVWEHVRDMNVARSDASACVHEQLIYIAGGLNDQVIESSVEFYNHLDDTWTFAGSMLTPRTSFTLLLYNSSLLAIGGNNGTERLASCEQYNFVTKLWSPHSEMRHRRSTFSAALVDECKLIVVGGYNGQTPFNQVEMYDDSQRQWVLLHKIRYDRSGLKVVAVDDLPNAIDYTFLGRTGEAGNFVANSSSDYYNNNNNNNNNNH